MKNRGEGLGSRAGGFTIIELVLTMVLVSITIFGTAAIILEALDGFGLARERRQAVQGTRYAVDRMVREIRQIASPATFVLIANATTFRYATQLVPLSFVTYQFVGAQLLRDGNLMVDNILPGASFTYFNPAGLAAVGIVDIARIRINLTANTANPAYGTVNLQTDVYLRNRHYTGFTQP